MHTNTRPVFHCSTRQRGFSLITTLILLVIVSMLGISASQMVLMSERTSRFDRDSQIAFQAAEAALVDAELDIQGSKDAAGNYVVSGLRMDKFEPKNKVDFSTGCGTGALRGMCAHTEVGQKPVWYQVDFTDESANAKTVKFGEFTGRSFAVGATGIRPEIAPRYIVEVIPDLTFATTTDAVLYRITAMGFGPRKETQVVLQVVFRKA
jgi:type IV pilus assembly protein PilX